MNVLLATFHYISNAKKNVYICSVVQTSEWVPPIYFIPAHTVGCHNRYNSVANPHCFNPVSSGLSESGGQGDHAPPPHILKANLNLS